MADGWFMMVHRDPLMQHLQLHPAIASEVTIRELSGDVNLTKAQIDETQIIVTTPEKPRDPREGRGGKCGERRCPKGEHL